MPLQEGFVLRPQIERGENPELVHLRGGRRPDSVKPLHRQRFDKARSHRGRDDEETVGLAMVGGELGEELVVGDAGRRRQLGLGADLRPDPFGNLGRGRDALQIFGHVEIGFVERQRLDDRRVLREDRADLQRHLLVDVEPRLHEDQVGAFSARRHRRHRRADTELARLIAGRGHHAACPRAADRNRLAAQLRIVALLHGRIERIHVHVDDLAGTFGLGLRLAAPICRRRRILATIRVGFEHDDQATRPLPSCGSSLARRAADTIELSLLHEATIHVSRFVRKGTRCRFSSRGPCPNFTQSGVLISPGLGGAVLGTGELA